MRNYINSNQKIFFQIEQWNNALRIYDGSDDKSMQIGVLFGTPNHNVVKSISSLRRTMFIDFKRHYLIEYDYAIEFVASIKYNEINPDCQCWLDKSILMSPNNPNINCSWIITRKYKSYITLDFNYIEVLRSINGIVEMQ